MQLNIGGFGRPYVHNERSALMAENSQSVAASTEDPAARLTVPNKRAVDFISRSQCLLLEEAAFAGHELLDRTRTELHLFSELASKMAGSHSVKDLRATWEECGQHQI